MQQIPRVIAHRWLPRKIAHHAVNIKNYKCHKCDSYKHLHTLWLSQLKPDITVPAIEKYKNCNHIDKWMHMPCSRKIKVQKPDSGSCKSAGRTRISGKHIKRTNAVNEFSDKHKIGDYNNNRPFCLFYIFYELFISFGYYRFERSFHTILLYPNFINL